jgi:cytosine/uracil/thiamine/allantoin permease
VVSSRTWFFGVAIAGAAYYLLSERATSTVA